MANALARPSRSPVQRLSTLISGSLENFEQESGKAEIDGIAIIGSRKSQLRRGGGAKTSGNILDTGAVVLGTWTYTPQASS